MGRTSLFTAPLGHTHPETKIASIDFSCASGYAETKIAPLLISLDVYAQQAPEFRSTPWATLEISCLPADDPAFLRIISKVISIVCK